MEKSKIIDSLTFYFESDFTDYAVMITGEWGVGKTHFLRTEVFPLINKLDLRPIYISLIGLNSDDKLEKLIFQKLNPFYKLNNQSPIAREAEIIEAIINKKERPDLNIPENIVLCFDDLERIKPEFFETAMGFINVFIEHYNTKCVFLCNEQIIEKGKISNYRIVKEKYIRFCYSFSPIFKFVIEEKLTSIEPKHVDFYDILLIVNVFERGNTYNLRTLFFVLAIFEQILNEIEKFTDKPKGLKRIINLILTYCCFYTIELKKGTPDRLLDKITIANGMDAWSNLLKNEEVFNPVLEDSIKEVPLDDISAELKLIQERYFNDESIQFERFLSVAELIKNGYLDAEMLKDEIIYLDSVFPKIEMRDKESKMVNKLEKVFELSDSELIPTIKSVINEVEKGTFNLQTYLKLFRDLVWLESCKIEGVEIGEEEIRKFREGVEKASKSGELRFIQNLLFQFHWSQDDKNEYSEKFNLFAAYVDTINNKLNNEKHFEEFEAMIKAIKENKGETLYDLIKKETDFRFIKEHAKDIYDLLINANANTTIYFFNALQSRYANSGSILSQMPEIEKEFIIALFSLLKKDEKLNPDIEKPLSKLPLVFLKDYLNNLIKQSIFQKERNKDEV